MQQIKMGDLAEMPVEDFKILIGERDYGYALGCNNLLTLCFDNVSKRISALLAKSVEFRKKDKSMSKIYQDYANRLIYSQKSMEDKLIFLKEYLAKNK